MKVIKDNKILVIIMTICLIVAATGTFIALSKDNEDFDVNKTVLIDTEKENQTEVINLNPAKNLQDSRNARRASDVSLILNAIAQYISLNGNSINDFENISECNDEADIPVYIGNESHHVNLEEKLVEEYIVSIPEDPSKNPNDDSSGYTICITSDNRIQISAPYAEDGKVISVER